MKRYIQVTTTAGNKQDAEKIARSVAERHLASCVQILGPITSIYWWKGQLEQAEEWLCIFKSRDDLYGKLETAILNAHSYEVPEILAVPVTHGSKAYCQWLDEQMSIR